MSDKDIDMVPMEKLFLERSATDPFVEPGDLHAEVRIMNDSVSATVVGWHKGAKKYKVILKTKVTGQYYHVSPRYIHELRLQGLLRRAGELAGEASEEQA